MSERILECRHCGERERASALSDFFGEGLGIHLDVRRAIGKQHDDFLAAHAGCEARVARTARRLDALDPHGQRWAALRRG